MTPSRPTRTRAAWVVLGGLTAVQLGIGAWRAMVMLREGIAAGVRPLGWSGGLGLDLLLCAGLAAIAWWWLPPSRPRTAATWGLRFLLLSWTLALTHYAFGLVTGRLTPSLTWPVLGALAVTGLWARRMTGGAGPPPAAPPPATPWGAGARWLAAGLFLMQLPHLIFPYHFTDAQDIWACRAFHFAQRAGLVGVFDCLDAVRPPLHSVILWLGVGDPTFQGRLLPLLMFGAFALLFSHLLRRVAPRLGPWGLVWLLATDHVFKGQVSAYAGVPVTLAVVAAIALAVDEETDRAFALWALAVAGAAIALIRRDGLPEFVVAMMVLAWTAHDRRDLRLWAPLAGAAAGLGSWVLRPAMLRAPALFAPTLAGGPHWTFASAAAAMGRLGYGIQGQVLSHYGYGAFAWAWLTVVIWAARVAPRRPGWRGDRGELAARFGLAGLAAWIATALMYAALTFLGQPQLSTLFIIRTGFGRHLVHFFPLCLLHATATAERLLGAPDA